MEPPSCWTSSARKIGSATTNLFIMDMTSRACGQHCLYYILNRYHKPELNLEDLIQCIYHKSDLKDNDIMVTVLSEKLLFK